MRDKELQKDFRYEGYMRYMKEVQGVYEKNPNKCLNHIFFLNARLKLNFGPPRVQHSNAQKRNRTKRFCTVSGHFKLFQRDTRPLLLYFQHSHSLGSLSLGCAAALFPQKIVCFSL